MLATNLLRLYSTGPATILRIAEATVLLFLFSLFFGRVEGGCVQQGRARIRVASFFPWLGALVRPRTSSVSPPPLLRPFLHLEPG